MKDAGMPSVNEATRPRIRLNRRTVLASLAAGFVGARWPPAQKGDGKVTDHATPKRPPRPGVQTLMSGLAIGESPRWHEGRLWLCNWLAQEIVAVDLEGRSQVVVRVPFESFPFSIAWLPDGRLLIVSASDRPLLRREADGSLVAHADLSRLAARGWNEIVVDGRGNTYLNGMGFRFGAEEFRPGIIALVTPDGSARQVADGIAFPNGMVVTQDGSTLIIAESFAGKLTAFDIAEDGNLSNRRLGSRRRSRRDLHRRRGRDLDRIVRGRVRADRRGRRDPGPGRTGPDAVRVHARRTGREHLVHHGHGLARGRGSRRQHDAAHDRGTDGTGPDRSCSRAARGSAVIRCPPISPRRDEHGWSAAPHRDRGAQLTRPQPRALTQRA